MLFLSTKSIDHRFPKYRLAVLCFVFCESEMCSFDGSTRFFNSTESTALLSFVHGVNVGQLRAFCNPLFLGAVASTLHEQSPTPTGNFAHS